MQPPLLLLRRIPCFKVVPALNNFLLLISLFSIILFKPSIQFTTEIVRFQRVTCLAVRLILDQQIILQPGSADTKPALYSFSNLYALLRGIPHCPVDFGTVSPSSRSDSGHNFYTFESDYPLLAPFRWF